MAQLYNADIMFHFLMYFNILFFEYATVLL